MTLTGENQSTGRKTCHSASLSTTNPTWTDLVSNMELSSEGRREPETNCLSHDSAIQDEN
jgi:hypothetical protein